MKHLFNKLSALLIMLMCMSATAQAQTEVMTMVVTKKNGDVTRIVAKNIEKVEWTNEKVVPVSGLAKANLSGIEVDVKWMQLWENGPKFAEYNVGATKVGDSGGNYCWGGSIDNDPGKRYNTGDNSLTGNADTATKLWGNNWRMPTKAEFQALIDNCDVEVTTVEDVVGCKFTGRGNYSRSSIFLPAAGNVDGNVGLTGVKANYWSSTQDSYYFAYSLVYSFEGQSLSLSRIGRSSAFSVRAVLAK